MPKPMQTPGDLVAWLEASKYRECLFYAVARLNRRGRKPTTKLAMSECTLAFPTRSYVTNGQQAIRDLVAGNLLLNHGTRSRAALEVNWATIGAISDWQEEQGLPRLDEESCLRHRKDRQ